MTPVPTSLDFSGDHYKCDKQWTVIRVVLSVVLLVCDGLLTDTGSCLLNPFFSFPILTEYLFVSCVHVYLEY